jgi:hypothetical protein
VVEVMDMATLQWERGPLLLSNRGSHGAACYQGRCALSCGLSPLPPPGSVATRAYDTGVVYAIGGGGLESNLDSCECLVHGEPEVVPSCYRARD